MSKSKITAGVIVISIVIIAVGIVIAQNKASESGSNQNATTTPSQTASSTSAAAYTLADVATHNSAQNCWSAINGKVYNLTSWIGQHPGGQQAILSICGKDGSAAFNGQHGGQARPASELANFFIGTLSQ